MCLGCALLILGLVVAGKFAGSRAQALRPLAAIAPYTPESAASSVDVTPTANEPEGGRLVIINAEDIRTAAQIAADPPPPPPESPDLRRIQRVTAYCDRGTTAAGVPSGVGQCAAPIDIPFGSKIYIPSLGRTFIVTDRTHRRFRYNTVDIFIPSKSECLKFGRRYVECHYSLVDEPPPYGKVRVPSPGR